MQTGFLSGDLGILFSILLHGGDHGIHYILNCANLRMHFFNKVMFELGQPFDTLALFLYPPTLSS